MSEHFDEIQKLKDFLRRKNLGLSEEKIEKNSAQLLELGFFLVRLKVKQHSKATEKPKDEDLEQKTGEPPLS